MKNKPYMSPLTSAKAGCTGDGNTSRMSPCFRKQSPFYPVMFVVHLAFLVVHTFVIAQALSLKAGLSSIMLLVVELAIIGLSLYMVVCNCRRVSGWDRAACSIPTRMHIPTTLPQNLLPFTRA